MKASLTKLNLLVTAAALALLAQTGARAADMVEEAPVYVEPAAPIEEPATYSGWYLRGDVAYTFESKTHGHYHAWDAAAYPDLQRFDYDELRYKWGHDVSFGIGYQFNESWRGDLTAGHWSRKVKGSASSPWRCLGVNPADVSCRFDDSSDVEAWEFMANGYYDFLRWGRFTPYVGAGLGFARVSYGDLRNEATCLDAGGSPIGGCGYVADHPGRDSNRFVWALMAGTSIDINERLKADIGYRFARTEGGDAWGWDASDTSGGATGTQSYDHGFDVHQIRAGLRFTVW